MTAPLNEPEIVNGRPPDEPSPVVPPRPSEPSQPVAPPNQIGSAPQFNASTPSAPPNQLGGLRLDPGFNAWTDDNLTQLEHQLRIAYNTPDDKLINDVSQMVMGASGPDIMDLPEQRFRRQVGLSTQEMFEEQSLRRFLGVVGDDEALAQASIDTFLETQGAVVAASRVFAASKEKEQWFTDNFLENRRTRDNILERVRDEVSETRDILPYQFSEEIQGLRGKKAKWSIDGDTLAIQWFNEGSDTPSTDTLIFLEEGTEIRNSADVLTEYLLADDGVKHLVSPTSGKVTGRQNMIGALIEGTNNIIKSVERFGDGFLVETIAAASTEASTAIGSIEAIPDVDREAADAEAEALREQQTIAAVTRNNKVNGIAYIAQRHMAENPDASMSSVVAAGITGYAELPDDVKESNVAQSIQDLEKAAAADRDESSIIGRFLEEDVGPPVLDFLQQWEGMIQFVGVTAQDFTNIDAIVDLKQRVDEEGIGALASVDFLRATLNPAVTADLDTVTREFNNIREEGLPKATAAYIENVQDIGTVADYYGIDEDSNYYLWANVAGSVAYDPLTWLTVGGAASWNGLKKGITTDAGVRRLVSSRPMMSAARNLVDRNTIRILPVLSEGNMSSSAIGRLARIGKTEYATKVERVAAIKEVKEIFFDEIRNGMYRPAGPARLMRRKTVGGLANLAIATPRDPKARSVMQDVLIRASRSRFAYTNERNWLDDVFKQIEVRRINDVDGFSDDIVKFLDIYDAYRSGDTTVAMIQGRAQVLKQELADLAIMPPETGQVPKLRKWLTQWNDSVKELDDRIAGVKGSRSNAESAIPQMRTDLEALRVRLASLTDRQATKPSEANAEAIKSLTKKVKRAENVLDETVNDVPLSSLEASRAKAIAARDEVQALLDVDGSAARYDKRITVLAQKRNELKRIQAQVEALGTGSRDRSLLERATIEYLYDWADELGVPVLRNTDGSVVKHPVFSDIVERDWSVVNGQSGASASKSPSPLTPFGEKGEEGLKAIGMQSLAGVTPLPVSTIELLAWSTMQRNAATRKIYQELLEHTAIKTTLDTMQGVWAASVLMNPMTAFRSHLDEVVRFFEDAGMSVDLLKTTTPDSRITGKVGTEAAAFGRDNVDSVLAPGQQAWQMVTPKQRGMWRHAERWVNGTIVQDPIFKAYARAVTEGGSNKAAVRAIWEEWWNREGVKLAKRATFDGTEITGGNSFDIIDGAFKTWSGGIKKATKKGQLTQRDMEQSMLSAAANNKQVPWDAAVWRQLPDVPAQISTRSGATGAIQNTVEAGFKLGYGAPQQRRGSVFYDHYYEWVKSTYDESFKGKIIDEDFLLNNGYATNRVHAQELVNQGRRSQVVRDLIADTGMMTETDIQNAAMRWAASSADDMMYTFGATSILGKKAARIYPFGRAQVDYMQWWWKKLTQPTQLVGGAQIPGVNLRLVDRMAKLALLDDDSDARPGALTPAGIVNSFTFLPTGVNEQVLIGNLPGVGGALPGWLMNAPAVPDAARNAFQELHPSHRIFSEPFDNYGDMIVGFRDALFPKGGLSVRNEVAAAYNLVALATAYVTLNLDPRLPLSDDDQLRVNKTLNGWVRNAGAGPWRNDRVKVRFADWMTQDDNVFRIVPDYRDDDLMNEWRALNDSATVESLTESTADFLSKIAGVASYGGSDFAYVETLFGVEDFVDKWSVAELDPNDLGIPRGGSGSISDAKRDSIKLGLALVQSGESTAQERLEFADEVLDAVFKLITDDERAEFIATNPQVTANLVSFSRVIPGLVPNDARDGIVGDRIRTNDLDRARELRRQGNDEGWLVDRDSTDVEYDMMLSAHRSFREYLDVIYRDATGIDLSARTMEIGGEKVPTSDLRTNLTPEWWNRHGEWLDRTGQFQLPSGMKGDLKAGLDVEIGTDELKALTLTAKKSFVYAYPVDSTSEAKLNRIGIDDRPPTQIAARLSTLPGFDMADFDNTVGLSYYGEQLMKDFDEALSKGQELAGWQTFDEWDVDNIEYETLDEDGNFVTVTYSPDELRARFRVAIAISRLNADDEDRFDEKAYDNSMWGRALGSVDWEPPAPPALSEVKSFYEETNPGSLHVIDGDTIEIATDEGPVFVRLLGINTPERGEDGFLESLEGLQGVVNAADKVQFAIWEPDRYGFRMSSFTEEDNVVVTRDRYLVWVYFDGVPLLDPNEFSRSNIRGARTGGTVPNYKQLLADRNPSDELGRSR